MITFKKILWPTDFSEPSYEAFKTAKELALHFSSELYLVHVVTPMPPLVETPRDRPSFNVSLYRKELRSSAEKSLQEVIDKKIGERLKVRALVTIGDAAVEITRIAKRENVELIVIATQGTTGRRRFFLGSVAEKVVRIASTPILTIRAPSKEE
ncbi:MAG: universal stress protein [Candidatus Aminicenantes bacterium]|nr:universal stress protein [Candidatus Aminicenantes bacterium]